MAATLGAPSAALKREGKRRATDRKTRAGRASVAPVRASRATAAGGRHQAGVVTPQQEHFALAAYDLTAGDAGGLRALLVAWTGAAARLAAGRRSVAAVDDGAFDSGEAHELEPARLTVTLGLGPGVFDGRFGLGDRRPVALRPLPPYPGDELDERRCGGDLCVQACADDPQVVFHAVRTLTRVAAGLAEPRWAQTGFVRHGTIEGRGRMPRNLLGFREGANNLRVPEAIERHVWVARGDRTWMAGGTYAVVRRIRLALDRWDASPVAEQERAIGRRKVTGAQLAPPETPEDAHVRLAGPGAEGARMLRRSYNYFDGVDPATRRLDAGLVLVAFVRDPRRQFDPVQRRLAERDALRGFGVHTGSAVFAIPPAPAPGGYVGDGLLG